MNDPAESSAVTTIKADHVLLNQEIASWRRWCAELSEMGQPHFGEMGARLARFRAHLVANFDHVESLLSQSPPQAAKQLPRSREEFADLLRKLDAIILRLQAEKPDFECWGAARQECEQFLDLLLEFEANEEELFRHLQKGKN